MKHRRLLLPGLALVALVGSGCFLVSGQFQIHFDVGDVTVANPSAVNGVYVDLTTIADYNDNRAKLEDLSDLALLGTFTNNGVSALDVEVWITGSATGTLTDTKAGTAKGTAVATLMIGGTADDKETIADFVDALAKLKEFANPYVTVMTTNKDQVDFSMTADVTPDALCGRYTTVCKTGGN